MYIQHIPRARPQQLLYHPVWREGGAETHPLTREGFNKAARLVPEASTEYEGIPSPASARWPRETSPQEQEDKQVQEEPKQEQEPSSANFPFYTDCGVYGLGYTCSQLGSPAPTSSRLTACRPRQRFHPSETRTAC